jgi:hypothetical protein
MSGVIGGVARCHPVGDGHGPIGGDGQDPHQLAQVGPVVLVVAECDRSRRLAAPGAAVGAAVLPGEAHGGGVVVQLRAVDAEGPHGPQDNACEQRGSVGVEEPLQAAPHPVVVQQRNLARPEAQQRRRERGGPLAEGVDGLMVHDEVAHDDTEGGGRGEPQPAVIGGHMGRQGVVNSDAAQEVVHHWQSPDPLAKQCETLLWADGSLPHEPEVCLLPVGCGWIPPLN